MKYLPTYFFEDSTETGVDKIKAQALIILGRTQPRIFMKLSNGDLDENSTVDDLISDPLLCVEIKP